MPKLTYEIDNQTHTLEVPAGKRLIHALIDDAKTDQLHACGGHAACTTCRVQFVSGEPEMMTAAEKGVLAAKGIAGQPGLRLSCQMTTDQDMSVKIISRFAGSGRKDAGKPCAAEIEPPAVWERKG